MAGRYALIVANASYQDAKLSRLRTPARDAEELARVLHDPAIGDFDVELSMDEPEHALRRRIATFFAMRDRDDLLLLHFSCHGLKDDSGELYFAATDTEVAQLDATAVSADFVSRQMTRSRSRKVIALLDCCYSGAIARGLRFRAGETVQLDDHLGGHGRVILTASSAMEYAFEGDELTGSGTPSVFTGAVVRGLETGEADRDQDRRISVEDLYDYVCEQVRQVTPDQTPNMLSHLEGELYIARSSYIAPVEAAELPLELRGAIDSPFAGVREGVVTELARLADGPDPGGAVAARAALQTLADDDSRRVAAAAARALAAQDPGPHEPTARVQAAAPAAPAPAVESKPAPPPIPPTEAARPALLRPSSGSSRERLGTALPKLLAVLGAALIVASLSIFASEAWPDPYRDLTIAASIAAVVAALLIVARPAAGGVTRDAVAVALVMLPLGIALVDGQINGDGTDPYTASTRTIIGCLLMIVGALWHPGVQAPASSSRVADRLVLLASGGFVIGSASEWSAGAAPSGLLLFGLLLAAAVATASALGRRLEDRARGIARAAAVGAPAAGVLGLVAALTTYVWLHRTHSGVAADGMVVMIYAAAALTMLGGVALKERLRD